MPWLVLHFVSEYRNLYDLILGLKQGCIPKTTLCGWVGFAHGLAFCVCDQSKHFKRSTEGFLKHPAIVHGACKQSAANESTILKQVLCWTRNICHADVDILCASNWFI